jgi:hypothetical protein
VRAAHAGFYRPDGADMQAGGGRQTKGPQACRLPQTPDAEPDGISPRCPLGRQGLGGCASRAIACGRSAHALHRSAQRSPCATSVSQRCRTEGSAARPGLPAPDDVAWVCKDPTFLRRFHRRRSTATWSSVTHGCRIPHPWLLIWTFVGMRHMTRLAHVPDVSSEPSSCSDFSDATRRTRCRSGHTPTRGGGAPALGGPPIPAAVRPSAAVGVQPAVPWRASGNLRPARDPPPLASGPAASSVDISAPSIRAAGIPPDTVQIVLRVGEGDPNLGISEDPRWAGRDGRGHRIL